MIQIDSKYKLPLLESLEDSMYKLSLQIDDLKGGPLDKERKLLTKKQKNIEKVQHIISTSK